MLFHICRRTVTADTIMISNVEPVWLSTKPCVRNIIFWKKTLPHYNVGLSLASSASILKFLHPICLAVVQKIPERFS